MTNEIEEASSVSIEGGWWCTKIFEYVKNRNRIGPGKVELLDCDFFVVAPRRTIRVLLPTPRGSIYYDSTKNERPETLNDNFISRWASRLHLSDNCRCSFRQSKNCNGTSEERMINDEINRIRTSLCEAEKSGENLEMFECRLSSNLKDLVTSNFSKAPSLISSNELTEEFVEDPELSLKKNCDEERAIKNQIVVDLELYIEKLKQGVLNDTMKFVNDADNTLRMSNELLKNNGKFSNDNKFDDEKIFNDTSNSFDIAFDFDESSTKKLDDDRTKDYNGYVNRGYSGNIDDPDCLEFDLQKSQNNTLENLDCTDSGINSVETMEFQTSQEPSLEQSLMEIIDAKFDSTSLKRSLKNLSNSNQTKNNETTNDPKICSNNEICSSSDANFSPTENDELKVEEKKGETREFHELKETKENSKTRSNEESLELEKIDEISFVDLQLEFVEMKISENDDDDVEITKNGVKKIDGITSSPVVELRRKNNENREIIESYEKISDDGQSTIVKLRKIRKPTIVFLHGFGSSAEIFDNQLKYFSNLGYPCIAPDILGHGMSSAPDRSRDYHFEKLFKDLEIILQHYAFAAGRKCVLVGHNYGCSFATALACKYDSNVHQLVLISGGGPTPLAPPSIEGTAHCCLRALLTPLLMCGFHRDILYSPRGRQHPYCGPEPIEQWPMHMKYVLDGMIWPDGDYVFHRRICAPTLLIHGLRDDKVSLVQECQMERTIIKAFLDAIPAAGHTPMIDTPDQVNHMIHCFIDLWKQKKR